MELRIIPAIILVTATSVSATVPEDVTIGGFIDTYYAWDFNQPKDHERKFTTQPVRHNEFNVNLAYIEANIKRETTRGRLALQYGNSVTKNTAAEPKQGQTSGPQDAKIFQEAFVGKRIGEKTWIDGGIFLGNIGAESWISKDNFTYTRALNLDYVPYYSAGIRIEHALSEKESFQFQILNGWQNMSEDNQGKAIGTQYKRHLSEKAIFTYNTFFGDEEQTFQSPRFRGYHNFILSYNASSSWQFLGAFDIGHQAQKTNHGVDAWYATTFTARRVLSELDALAARIEWYNDRHECNVRTNTPDGFQVSGASVNFDRKLDEKSLWRTELRGFYSKDEIYPVGSGRFQRLNGFLVTSLSLWI